jgi:hypothetical protein
MIKFQLRGNDKLGAYLKEIPRGVMRVAMKAVAEYILGNERHGLRHNDAYKYVSRQKAYGQPFFSEAQRKYVMAKIRSGEIVPGVANRTNQSSEGWSAVPTSNGYGYSFRNSETGAYYTRSDKGQARQPALVGWRKTSKVIQDNIVGAIRSARAKVSQWIAANK